MARARLQLPEIPAPDARPAGRGMIGQEAYERIRSAILNASFTPGMALSELAVSQELGMSRAPVRDAFRRLVGEGLLEVRPQRGTFVTRLSHAQIEDAIFVREAIECLAAELACAAPLAERKKLREVLQRQIDASDRQDFAGHLKADEDLHYQILVLARHPHAWNPLMLARTGMTRIRHIAIPELGGNRIAIEQHRQLVRAIVAGKPVKARELMLLHIRSPLRFVAAISERHPDYFVRE
jgi:GntR family transcriptional regulator, rspAB operon transcriptional repressor